jgi:hypothetical protein
MVNGLIWVSLGLIVLAVLTWPKKSTGAPVAGTIVWTIKGLFKLPAPVLIGLAVVMITIGLYVKGVR